MTDLIRTVRYLTQQEKIRSRALYEEMFWEDEAAFVDAYYKYKGAFNRVLVLEEQGELLSMLHLNPYRFWMQGALVESSYIVAVATRPAYRHQGCMRRLLEKALEDLYGEGQPFAFLMPAKEAIYTPFGFRFMKNQDEEKFSAASMEALQKEFSLFVWKDADYEKQRIPDMEWETTPMMVWIVNLRKLLAHIGTGTSDNVCFRIRIEDEFLPGNQGDYEWIAEEKTSRLEPVEKMGQKLKGQEGPYLKADIADLGSFLFGAKEAAEVFLDCPLEILKKLEKIQVIRKIFINETV